jgi:hypothetical protein
MNKPVTCRWEENEESIWDTACGEKFVLNDGTPHDNGMIYCPYCGKTLYVVKFVVDESPVMMLPLSDEKRRMVRDAARSLQANTALLGEDKITITATHEDSDGTGYCRGCGTTIGEHHHHDCDLLETKVQK